MNESKFSPYQWKLLFLIACVQFAVVLDFMVLAPLGDFLMTDYKISKAQYSHIVAAYAFAAFISALLSSLIADRFDRKRLLIFFFSGFILGTLYCAIAPSYEHMLCARIIAGFFGGVMSSISYAIVTDSFETNKRGRVMGVIQLSFGVSQIFGIPIALSLFNSTGQWQIIFFIIVGFAIVVLIAVFLFMRSVKEHLTLNIGSSTSAHLTSTLKNIHYLKAFGATVLLATGGFMIMPFTSDFAINNMKLTKEELPALFAIVGIFTFVGSFLAGYLADKMSRILLFGIGTGVSIIIALIYTHLGETTFWVAVILNCILFLGITARIIPAQAIMTTVPEPKDRGMFMSVNAAIQQLSGGIGATVAGMIVYENKITKELVNFDHVGIVVSITMLLAFGMFSFLVQDLGKRNEN